MTIISNYKKKILTLILLLVSGIAHSSEALTPPKLIWPFNGPFGKFDIQSIQRGFQVYKEVCSTCHSLKLVAYRNLTEIGFSEAEVKSVAAQYNLNADPDENGEIKQRPALPSDHFVSPYLNENAARAANGGANPVDQSLIIKARHNGPDYIYALLTGYKTPPENHPITEGKYYNPYFAGGEISMPPPLHDKLVTYMDGTDATVEQMAKDIVNFLQWAAEPEMQKRKSIGIKVLLYLFVMTFFFIIAKRRVWKDIE